MFFPSDSTVPKLQTAEDLQGDALLHYDAEMELMNLILLSIPNDIYNSVDACTSAKDMWKRVERLMRRSIQNKVDRETRFINEFDQFVAELEEALVSVYNRFAQLMNDLGRNDMHFLIVTINIKFLNSLQPEWLKYVTQVRLAKHLIVDTFDDLFDYLQQFEKLVNTSRAKKLLKTHDPLALVARTSSSSRNTSSYYVTHPTSVVDYDDENFGNAGRNNRRAYVQEEVVEGSNETGNVQMTLRNLSSRNTSNVQCYNCSGKVHYARNCPKPRVWDSKYFMEQILLAKQDEARVILTDEQNDFLFADASIMEEIKDLSANICLMARIQPTDHSSDVGPSYDSAFVSEVQSSSITENEEQMYPTHTKIINSTIGDDQIDSNIIFDTPNGNVNSGSVEKGTHVPDLYALEQLARNAYQEAEKQQIFAQKVQTQNKTLTSQLELYKERVRVLENINENNNYLNEFLEADQRAKHFNQQAHGCSKHMTGDRSLLRNFIEKFMGTVRFVNDNFAAITGYGDYIKGNITICHVYYVEGLGHNLFSLGQFCDGDLEMAFHSKACYVRNMEGDDLLMGGRESNLYTISISDMAASSPVCLILKLVYGLPKFKYEKDHLCSTYERGKSKKASHPPKLVSIDNSKLELLHMDLCGPMRVASINGKKYILVIMDDYSRYTWVYFLHSKDETLEIIKKFIAQAQLNYKAKIGKIRTDNGTEFKIATLKAHYEKLGIMQ
nr:integrase, catalytic region, zinc finger, CCHC-type, peptidase aspartic, catalytic [Tanacetum cinerariifolium]